MFEHVYIYIYITLAYELTASFLRPSRRTLLQYDIDSHHLNMM